MEKAKGDGTQPIVVNKFSPEGVEAIREIARQVFQEEVSGIITKMIKATNGAASPGEQPKIIDRD